MQRTLLLLGLPILLVACAEPRTLTEPTAIQPVVTSVQSDKPQLLVRQCRNLPEYPRAARDRRATGTVVISITVAADGSVARSELKQSSGHADLDQAALSTLSKCPARASYKNGQPVEATTDITYIWRLDY